MCCEQRSSFTVVTESIPDPTLVSIDPNILPARTTHLLAGISSRQHFHGSPWYSLRYQRNIDATGFFAGKGQIANYLLESGNKFLRRLSES
jgi:hypothetical protein